MLKVEQSSFKSSHQYHCDEAEKQNKVALGSNSTLQNYAFKSYTEERIVKLIAFKFVTIYEVQMRSFIIFIIIQRLSPD
ncbi:hypothetical protein T4A_5070 [Trichinella pseudospiralis]|uniref:Uncharacterized protein n=1 Tax=Trichinella pseudospiralis TaxID=6337 RepID=A0A0V1E624_TRIPS|nr:hypothetical protein T4A_5070 [Trichinella pseudospiralis]KRZ43668.1 hypothetical protein T4C_5139 [Trichinella pseudospiralis]